MNNAQHTASCDIWCERRWTSELAAIVQSSHDAIVGYNLEGFITSWNASAERMYGYAAHEVLGKHRNMLTHEGSRVSEADMVTRVAGGERIEIRRSRRVHQNGENLEVTLSVSPIAGPDGVIVGIASASREVADTAGLQTWLKGVMDGGSGATVGVDGNGLIMLVNSQAEEMFGYTSDQLIGKPVDILVPLAPSLGKEQHALQQHGFPGGQKSEQIAVGELAARRRDGTTFAADIRFGSVEVGESLVVMATFRDVSDHIAVQEALRESEARLRALAESVDVGFVLSNVNEPSFLYVSTGFAKIYGYEPSVEIEDQAAALRRVHPEDLEKFRTEYWNHYQAGTPARAEYRIIRPDGEVRWLRAMTWPVVDPNGNVSRSAATVEDITDRKRDEADIRAAHAEAERANTAKNEFLSRMSHELRTPLNAVLGFGQLLEMDELSGPQQDAVQHILRGGRHLLALIDDVLDIAKIEGDRLEMTLEPVLVSELLDETIELMTPMALSLEVTLRHLPDTDNTLCAVADRRRLRQVIINLLSNAIKYNRRNGRVNVNCRAAGPVLEIVVQDTGRGIRPEHIPRLFTPFDRLGAGSSGVEGTGVGLALSERLMSIMGGTLRATSQIGISSTFTASIPAATEESRLTLALETGASSDDPEVDESLTTLLYIEDNFSNIELMERLLAHRPGWRMVVAIHAQLGLELASTTSPALIFLDLHLPDMDGSEVIERLRDDDRTRDIPVIVVSADVNPHQIERLLLGGARDYLTKPLDVTKVLGMLDAFGPDPADLSNLGAAAASDDLADSIHDRVHDNLTDEIVAAAAAGAQITVTTTDDSGLVKGVAFTG